MGGVIKINVRGPEGKARRLEEIYLDNAVPTIHKVICCMFFRISVVFVFYVILARNCGLACCGENEMPTVISDTGVVGCEGHVTMLSTEVSLSRAHCICTPRGFSVSCLPAASVGLVMLPNSRSSGFSAPKKEELQRRRKFFEYVTSEEVTQNGKGYVCK